MQALGRQRRSALNHFYHPEVTTRITQRPANGVRSHLHELLRLAENNVKSASVAQACILRVLTEELMHHRWGTTEPDDVSAQQHTNELTRACRGMGTESGDDDASLSLAEKLLYVILRSSVLANYTALALPPSWDDGLEQRSEDDSDPTEHTAAALHYTSSESVADKRTKSEAADENRPRGYLLAPKQHRHVYRRNLALPIEPRLWLCSSTVSLVERSKQLQHKLRWGCDPDPVIEATLSRGAPPRHGQDVWLKALATSQAQARAARVWDDLLFSSAGPYRAPNSLHKASGTHQRVGFAWGINPPAGEEVGQLFRKCPITSPFKTRCEVGQDESVPPPPADASPSSPQQQLRPQDTRCATMGVDAQPFSVFKAEYNQSFPVCSMLFVAMHHCIVGVRDPYLLSTLGGMAASALPKSSEKATLPPGGHSSKPRMKRQGGATQAHQEVFLALSDEFTQCAAEERFADSASTPIAKKRRKMDPVVGRALEPPSGGPPPLRNKISRGLLAILEWACEHGTLFLRLQCLCDLGEQKTYRAGLGSYGQCAIDALRITLSLLRRQVVALAEQPGGPHDVSFADLLDAQSRLQTTAKHIVALSDVFLVTPCVDWDSLSALQSLSSATLLSSLFTHFAASNANQHRGPLFPFEEPQGLPSQSAPMYADEDAVGEDTSTEGQREVHSCCSPAERQTHLRGRRNKKRISRTINAVAFILMATLRPLHRMLHTWLSRGDLVDPLDEFFIVPSYGATRSGYTVDVSHHRLPCFISVEAAREILNGGVSLRVLRAAGTHVVVSAERQLRVLESRDGDAEASMDDRHDARLMRHVMKDFLESLLGQRSPLQFHPLPLVNLFHTRGGLSYWRAFYGACNSVLIQPLTGESREDRDEESYCTASPVTRTGMDIPPFEAVGAEDRAEATASLAPPPSSLRGATEKDEDAASHITIAMHSDSDGDVEHSDTAHSSCPPCQGSDAGLFLRSTATSILGLKSVTGKPPTHLRGSTSFSTVSRVTTALYGVITEEIRQVVQPQAQEEWAEKKSRLDMRREYEMRICAQRREERLTEWKAERLALRAERVQAIRDVVDTLRSFYATLQQEIAPLLTSPSQEEHLDSMRVVEGSPYMGRIVKPIDGSSPLPQRLPPILLYTAQPVPETEEPRGAVVSFREPCPVYLDAASLGTATFLGQSYTPSMQGAMTTTRSRRTSQTTASLAVFLCNRRGTPCTTPQKSVTPTTATCARGRTVACVATPQSVPITPSAAASGLGRDAGAGHPSSLWMNSEKRTAAWQLYDEEGFSHPEDIYTVADINDEEYFAKRVLPRVYDQSSSEAILAGMTEAHAQQQKYDVNSVAYQTQCAEVARRRLHCEDSDGDECGATEIVEPLDIFAEQQWRECDPRGEAVANAVWASADADKVDADDPSPVTKVNGRQVLVDGRLDRTLATLSFSTAQANTLQWCTRYYLTLARYTAGYLTHKALQMALMPPYGSLYRLIKQLIDVCLMQSLPVAARLVDAWEEMIGPALERGMFRPDPSTFPRSEILATLNQHFRMEWEQCVVSGFDTIQVTWHLEPQAHLGRARTVQTDAKWLEDTDLSAAASETLSVSLENPESVLAAAETSVGGFTDDGATATPLDFLSQLSLHHDRPCGGFWLLPDGVVRDYSDIHCTLLFWKTAELLVTKTWQEAMQCGESAVFYFFSATRYLITTLQQHLWHSLQALSTAYAATLLFKSGVLYNYRCLEQFTEDHQRFVAECRFAAMLSPAFARCRELIYGILRHVEEVKRSLNLVNIGLVAARRRIHAAYSVPTLHSDLGNVSSSSSDEADGEALVATLQAADEGGEHKKKVAHPSSTRTGTRSKSGGAVREKAWKTKRATQKEAATRSLTATSTPMSPQGSSVRTKFPSASSLVTSHRRPRTSMDTHSTTSSASGDHPLKKTPLTERRAEAAALREAEKEATRCRQRHDTADKMMRQKVETERRHVRELVRRRLRAVCELVGELVDCLTTIRDVCGSTGVAAVDQEGEAYSPGMYAQRAEALGGLVRSLESVVVSLRSRI